MGCLNQGNKAQTPVGYSHGTGVSTGCLATAVVGVDARGTPGVHGFVWGRATLLPALRCMRCGAPRECYTGLRGHPADPGSGDEALMCVLRNVTAWSSGGSYGGCT